ncbi:hypothetical protein B0H13DRAFT_2442657 [Mycena leptocephala]|nr:hypothetical protein B0H13DRAFT_2442657 [Mycena leptocephala]
MSYFLLGDVLDQFLSEFCPLAVTKPAENKLEERLKHAKLPPELEEPISDIAALFINLSIAAVLALAAGLVAAAPATHDTHFVSLTTPSGERVQPDLLERAPGTVAIRAPAPAPRSCANTDVVTCSSSHAPASSLQRAPRHHQREPGAVIGASPRAVCLGTGATECCPAVAGRGCNAAGPRLVAADKVFNVCFAPSNTNESGLAAKLLSMEMPHQCLSNRPPAAPTELKGSYHIPMSSLIIYLCLSASVSLKNFLAASIAKFDRLSERDLHG